MLQTKEQDRYPETNLNEMKISGVPDRKFKTHKNARQGQEQSDNFKKI